MDALVNLLAQAQAGIDCSYAHIVADGHDLGSIIVGGITNIATFVQALVK